MIKSLFQKILLKTGKTYTIDSNIPSSLFFSFLCQRFIMMVRGIVFLQKKVFLGYRCKIKNKSNIIFGKSVTIENYCEIDGYASQKMKLGNNVKIGAYSFVTTTSHMSKYGKGLSIGNNSACGRYCEFGASGGITIGNDVIMGSYISFHSENHNFLDKSKPIREQGVTSTGVKLGNNIWVGAKVTFLDGSDIGDNSVVAAGAVVTGKFPSNVVIGGIPAKILKEI